MNVLDLKYACFAHDQGSLIDWMAEEVSILTRALKGSHRSAVEAFASRFKNLHNELVIKFVDFLIYVSACVCDCSDYMSSA